MFAAISIFVISVTCFYFNGIRYEIDSNEAIYIYNKIKIVEAISRPTVESKWWNDSYTYANESKIHESGVNLYYSQVPNSKHKVIAINAGHGTWGGSDVRTYCHPDHSPKYTSGSTSAGALAATSINEGTSLCDGISEADANLEMALTVKDVLLNAGYDVLMIREVSDTRLDNVARTVMANQYADCHLSLHYDSTDFDKGAFCIIVPDIWEYKNMEPVSYHWELHNWLGICIINGFKNSNVKIFNDGFMGLDLTQTSYSTIPSIDIEVGDRISDHSEYTRLKIANGILIGLNEFYSIEGK